VERAKTVRFAGVSLAVLGVQLGCAAILRAQAWVPPRGEGTVSLTYENYDVIGHFDSQGRANTNGGTRSQSLITELDYGATDTIGFSLSLPFIASKYTGPPSYFVGPFVTFPGPLDDGSYHAAFQDLRIEARRMFLTGPLAVTPFIGGLFPTHDYETVGEAVPGRHRREIQLGASASARLDPSLGDGSVHVRYMYAAAERVNNFPYTRSNIDFEGDHAVTSRVALRGLARWQISHKGPTLAELEPDWVNHDRFIAPNYLELGGGASVSLTRSADVYALWVTTVSGSNGAHRERTLAVGASWGFGGGLGGLGAGARPSQRSRSMPPSPEPRPAPWASILDVSDSR
jgi:hypothetical protein